MTFLRGKDEEIAVLIYYVCRAVEATIDELDRSLSHCSRSECSGRETAVATLCHHEMAILTQLLKRIHS